jgi:hypothetical protein
MGGQPRSSACCFVVSKFGPPGNQDRAAESHGGVGVGVEGDPYTLLVGM